MRRTPRRGRGFGGALSVILVVLAILLVGLDFGVRFWAQRWLSGRLERTLSLAEPPDLQLGGFPFLLQVAEGRLSEVEAALEGVSADGLVLDRVRLRLERVHFSRGDLLIGGEGDVEVGRGTGEVEVEEASFNDYLRDQGVPVTVRLVGPRIRASAAIEVGGREASASAVGPLRIEDGSLVFEPRRVEVEGDFGVPPAALAFRLPLPPPFPGLRYEGARVREGLLVLQARLRDAAVSVSAVS